MTQGLWVYWSRTHITEAGYCSDEVWLRRATEHSFCIGSLDCKSGRADWWKTSRMLKTRGTV